LINAERRELRWPDVPVLDMFPEGSMTGDTRSNALARYIMAVDAAMREYFGSPRNLSPLINKLFLPERDPTPEEVLAESGWPPFTAERMIENLKSAGYTIAKVSK
jgi:hypothetical protein